MVQDFATIHSSFESPRNHQESSKSFFSESFGPVNKNLLETPAESQEGVMLSCCKGPPLNAEEAAPGRGGSQTHRFSEHPPEKTRENEWIDWWLTGGHFVFHSHGIFKRDIFVGPLPDKTTGWITARKCMQFLQGLRGHEFERGCLLPQSSWHQVRQVLGLGLVHWEFGA